MKTLSLTFIFGLFTLLCSAQEVDTLWFNSNWKKSKKEKSTYYRIIKVADDKKSYVLNDYFSTGELEMSGNYLSFSPEVKTGEFCWWYKNGNKKAQLFYRNNVLQKEKKWDAEGDITFFKEYVKGVSGTVAKGNVESDDKMPEFPGGQTAVYKFIADHFFYPKDIKPVQRGRVIIKFVVNATGDVVNVTVYEGLHPYLDQQVVKVIKSLPKWSPGTVNGKPVDVNMSLAINISEDHTPTFNWTIF